MTARQEVRPFVRSWARLRSPEFQDIAPAIISGACPDGLVVESVVHLRTAHYAVYKAVTGDGSDHIVRIGLASENDDAPALNIGFLGTSVFSPTGQRRELDLALGFAAAGASVAVPSHYVRHAGSDVLWAVPCRAGHAADFSPMAYGSHRTARLPPQ